MSLHDAKTEYDPGLTSVPPLEEEFSLEEILAEFGGDRKEKLLEEAERPAVESRQEPENTASPVDEPPVEPAEPESEPEPETESEPEVVPVPETAPEEPTPEPEA